MVINQLWFERITGHHLTQPQAPQRARPAWCKAVHLWKSLASFRHPPLGCWWSILLFFFFSQSEGIPAFSLSLYVKVGSSPSWNHYLKRTDLAGWNEYLSIQEEKEEIISLWMELKASNRICSEEVSFCTVGKIPRKYMKIFDYEIKVSYFWRTVWIFI